MLHRPDRGTNWPGHSVVEFGLVSLLFLAMFMGTADLGRAVFQRQELSNAVREGARFAMVAEDAREGTALVSQIASAASQRSPSFGLSATNFQSSAGGEVTCQEWPGASRSVPQQFADMPIMLGNSLIALGASAAKKPTPTPTRTPIGSQQPTATPTNTPSGNAEEDDGNWTTIACSQADPGDRLTICAAYTFRPVSMALLGLGPLAMTDCSTVTIQ